MEELAFRSHGLDQLRHFTRKGASTLAEGFEQILSSCLRRPGCK